MTDCAWYTCDGNCPSMCDVDQFLPHAEDNKECQQCHHTCKNGCVDSEPCDVDYICHPDCAECSGPGHNECTACFCNATLDDSGCCSCDEDYVGHANYCKFGKCHDQGCHVCVDNEQEHSCVTCKDNFQYVHTEDESFGYCEYCYDDDFYPFPTCGGVEASGYTVQFQDDKYTP